MYQEAQALIMKHILSSKTLARDSYNFTFNVI